MIEKMTSDGLKKFSDMQEQKDKFVPKVSSAIEDYGSYISNNGDHIQLLVEDLLSGSMGSVYLSAGQVRLSYAIGADSYQARMDSSGLHGNNYWIPATDNHYVQRKYVDDQFGSYVPIEVQAGPGETSEVRHGGGYAYIQVNNNGVRSRLDLDYTQIRLMADNGTHILEIQLSEQHGLLGSEAFPISSDYSFVQKVYVDEAITSRTQFPVGYIIKMATNNSPNNWIGYGTWDPWTGDASVAYQFVRVA